MDYDMNCDDVDVSESEVDEVAEVMETFDDVTEDTGMDLSPELEDITQEEDLEMTFTAEDVPESPATDFDQWCQTMTEVNPDLSEEMLSALWEAPDHRSYQETELVDLYRNPDYEGQRSILVDTDTGKAVQDEFGEYVDCPWNTKGAQRPDGMMVDEYGVHLREAKDYHDLNNLKQNIRAQTEDRREAFGDDVDLTYVVAPNFTIAEAEKLQAYTEKLGVNLEWQLK